MSAPPCIGGRFDVVRLAGEGGMGKVYEAIDRQSGQTVAVKVLHDEDAIGSGRFAREVRLLAELRHPGVVRYVAHGVTDENQHYLAMEWLAGETLAARLARAGLAISESVGLALGVARALRAVHRAGVVHRDLKPSNVFLLEGQSARPVLIDFGVARATDAGRRITRTGAMVGTPGYMSPEQMRGERRIDARSDVFALGCMLFRCLAGRDAFVGENALSVMFKVVLEEAPRVASLRPSVPAALDALVAAMLAKERAARPPDADAVVVALEGLEMQALELRRSVAPVPFAPNELTRSERRLSCLLMVRGAGALAEGDPQRVALVAAVERHHGRIEELAEGALLIVIGGAGAPTDLATRAARCALAVRDALGGAPVSLVAGMIEIEARLPMGDMIERAVHLLEAAGERGAVSPIRVDEVTAGLLGERFDVRAEGAALALCGEVEELDAGRRLLGRPTMCLGRERELGLLDALYTQCADDAEANAVLITAPPGVGKSRLRHELCRRLRARGQRFEVWIGHGDPMRAGSAFGLLARAVRHAAGVSDSDPLDERRTKISRLVARTGFARPADEARTVAFVGELTGAPFPETSSEELRAARADPLLLGDQIRRAAEDLLRGACASGPLLLVLEDLQWGDLPTVTFVDAALRNLADLPLMVMALGRPEVDQLFPQLWVDRLTQVVRLPPLPRRAAERLVRLGLGDAAPDELVGALVERAAGNAFYLEELTRAVVAGSSGAPAEGGEDRAALPETVLAMAQARLAGLDAELRRVLRAASVFGGVFYVPGVEALLGGAAVEPRIADLLAGEIIVRRDGRAPSGGAAYGFRHALVREAAYGMLTAEDRTLGHRLAGGWLLAEGHGDAMELAEHFERGGEPARASGFYLRAAEEALSGNDLAAALARAERGAACGAEGEELGALRLVQAEAHVWRGELAEGEARAMEAAALLAPGSARWFRALGLAGTAAEKVGALDRSLAIAETATAAVPALGAEGAQVHCLGVTAAHLVLGGRADAAEALVEQAEKHVQVAASIEPHALGVLHQARAFLASSRGDLGAALRELEATLSALERAGDRRLGCTSRMNLGFILAELGGFVEAERVLRAALADAERMGLFELCASTLQNLGYALMCARRLDEARVLLERALETLKRFGSARMAGITHIYLGRSLLGLGDAAAAERETLTAAELLLATPQLRAVASAVRSRALSARGRDAEALAAAEEAFSLLEGAGGALEEGEALVRLVHVEALAARGRRAEAEQALRAAKDRLAERAARISDPVWRERFLSAVPENAATLAATI